MGMTGKQWRSFASFLLMALRGVRDEPDLERQRMKLDEIINHLQKTLED